jgi:hypothetical protein
MLIPLTEILFDDRQNKQSSVLSQAPDALAVIRASMIRPRSQGYPKTAVDVIKT